MKHLNDFRIIILMCLTLGLAPFFPKPHIWEKLKWIVGGADLMQLKDWFDVILHRFPWVLLIRLLIVKGLTKKK